MIGKKSEINYFVTYNGLKMLYRAWMPNKQKSDYVFIGIHGAAVHSSNFQNFGDYFARLGYPVFVYDRRGFGNCDDLIRGYVDSYEVYVKDTIAFIDFIKSKSNPEKTFLIGHSNGSNIATVVAAEYPELIDSLVISSPNFRLKTKDPFSPFRLPLAYTLGNLIPKMKISTFLKPEELVRDSKIWESRKDDPLYTKKVTGRWVREMFNCQRQAKKSLKLLAVPTLILVAGEDKEISSKYTMKLYNSLENKDFVNMKIYEENYHENFNDLPESRLKVFEDIAEFLELK
ncbi:MAG: lysophospholipase [Candidatus Heimdallarchaeota archaeon]|nr:lysophospholipase [Candidatus Heimdallarchaeota archaeon]MBY8995401.1 lysophospholipase [Candidatus Heimdallarchaeota archaeon]